MNFFEDILNLFFPKLCCACDSPLVKNEELICFHCRTRLPKAVFKSPDNNELKDRFYGKMEIEFAFAYLYFHKSGLTQKLLHQFKYNNKPEIGSMIGNWLGFDLLKHELKSDIDLILPIPLHPKKQRKRGYNQSFHFAQGISDATKIPLDFNILKRIKHGESQTGKTREMRWKGVEQAFMVANDSSLQNKHVLLVDDVVTTGATIEACGRQLYKCGASKISVAAMAIAK
jgi:ComF family protein